MDTEEEESADEQETSDEDDGFSKEYFEDKYDVDFY